MSEIVLCQPRSGMDVVSTIAPSHALLCVAAPLDKFGYKVKIIDQRTNENWSQDLISELKTKPIYVGITCMVGTSVKFAIEIAKLVRRCNDKVPIVFGGPLPTLIPQQFIDSGLCDYVFQREVDETIVGLTQKIQDRNCPKIVDSPLPDMDKLLPEPYHLIDVEKYIHPDMYVKSGRRTMDVGQSSRRCPYMCLPKGTKVLLADLKWINIEDVKINDSIVGVKKDKFRYKYTEGIVCKTFSRKAEVYAIETDNGITYSTKDHSWLMTKAWRSIEDIEKSKKKNGKINSCRSALRKISEPILEYLCETDDYKKGYIVGATEGDGHLRTICLKNNKYHKRWCLVGDYEMLSTALKYGNDLGLKKIHERKYNGGKIYKCNKAIVCDTTDEVKEIEKWITYPETVEYIRGFLSGIYDAEGGMYGQCVRYWNKDIDLKIKILKYLNYFGFEAQVSSTCVTLFGGLSKSIRLLSFIRPSVKHKKDGWVNKTIHNKTRIKKIYSVGEMDVYNLQTTCENFIADGFVTHNCGFCASATIGQRKWRAMSADKAVDMIKTTTQKYNLTGFWLRDDEFYIDQKRAARITEAMIPLNMKWYTSGTRANIFCKTSDSQIELYKRAGAYTLKFGAESGNDRILQLMNKGTTVEQNLEANRLCKKHGITPAFALMCGFPTETFDEINDTIKMAKQMRKENPRAQFETMAIYTAHPGTPLLSLAEAHGLQLPTKLDDWSDWNADEYDIEGKRIPWFNKSERIALGNLCYISMLSNAMPNVLDALENVNVSKLLRLGYFLPHKFYQWSFFNGHYRLHPELPIIRQARKVIFYSGHKVLK